MIFFSNLCAEPLCDGKELNQYRGGVGCVTSCMVCINPNSRGISETLFFGAALEECHENHGVGP